MASNAELAQIVGYKWLEDIRNGAIGKVSLVEKKKNNPDEKRVVMKRVSYQFDYLNEYNHHKKLSDGEGTPGSEYIIKMFEMQIVDENVLFFLEHAEKGDLISVLRETTASMAKDFFRQLVSGMEYIHSAGIVHRDIKPGNLFINSTYTLKIGDFGMAEIYRESDGEELPVRRGRGTTGYIAPECFQYQVAIKGPPIDIWAAGIVLVNMLSKKQIWKDAKVSCPEFVKFKNKLYDDMILDWSTIGGAIGLLRKMLKIDPNQRATIEEIKSDRWFFSDADEEEENGKDED